MLTRRIETSGQVEIASAQQYKGSSPLRATQIRRVANKKLCAEERPRAMILAYDTKDKEPNSKPSLGLRARERTKTSRRLRKTMASTEDRLLVGDIGGTNTRLALFSAHHPHDPQQMRVYPSPTFPSLLSIVQLYLQEIGLTQQSGSLHAAFGVAGPVETDQIRLTNLPWKIDVPRFLRESGLATARFLNDFELIARAVPALEAQHLHPLGGGKAEPGKLIAVLGAGTGLGESLLLPEGNKWRVISTEGGHVDFSPRNALQDRLLHFLRARFGSVSWERALSGSGLEQLYAFLCTEHTATAPQDPSPGNAACNPAVLPANPLSAKEISQRALRGENPLCVEALMLFCELYGAEAGNLALKSLAGGGVYIAGGIAQKILPLLTQSRFRQAFEDKGRMRPVLEKIPVWVILHPQPGLTGGALAAAETLP